MMNFTNENDILFDDFSLLIKLVGKSDLTKLTHSNDCDCTGYTSTSNQDNCDTDKITTSVGKAD